ncbi:MAG: CoA ester lyase [Rickettsiales bacterium]|nr:CoA ester lyase [Rickettsiales bacterium]
MDIISKINRLNRSQLAVPAIREDFFEKAAKSNSDVVFLDLEDSVSIKNKKRARELAVQAINDIDWGKKTISVRVNAFDTEFFREDIKFIFENSNERLDLIMIPKSERLDDILEINRLVSVIETKKRKKKKIGFELIIETALGLINIEKLAMSTDRVESLHFGSADLAASMGAKTTSIGGVNKNYGILEKTNGKKNKTNNFYLNDMWHYALFKIVLTARAYGLRAIDCPYGDFTDNEGFINIATNTYSLGFEGKMVIHPQQVELANKVYSPSALEIEEATNIIKAMKEAEAEGKGAIAINGKLLDIVSIKQAKNILNIANKIAEGKE